VQNQEANTTDPRSRLGWRPWWIVCLLFFLTAVNFVDRAVIASIAPVLRSELHFSDTQYSYIVFAFMLGMTLGQVPVGMLLDRIGVAVGLPATLAGWSVANMVQAAARGVAGFSVPRFVMGLFECGSISGAVKTVAEVLPSEFRAVALGITNTGFLVGSVIAPPLVVYIIKHYGWRAAFLIPSVAGMLWIVPWVRTFHKAEKKEAVPSKAAGRPSVRGLLRIPQTWGVILMRATGGAVSQFYWYWLPLYFVQARGASLVTMAKMASAAYFVGAAGNVIGGYVSGYAIKRGLSVDRSRKLIFTIGAGLCALCTFLVPLMTSLQGAGLVIELALFGNNVTSCLVYTIISDVFPESSLASVTGMTGMGEGIIDMILTLSVGVIVDRFSFTPVFLSAAILPIASIIALFLLVRRCELLRPESLSSAG
jgi:MFS transporter, ACS family, aldohexuronate transporter